LPKDKFKQNKNKSPGRYMQAARLQYFL